MTRHEIRKEIFKAVFQQNFHNNDEMDQVVETFLVHRDFAEEEDLLKNDKSVEDEAYIRDKVADILSKTEELDALINEKADNWKTTRMTKVDLTLIRLGLYEIKYEGIDTGIAINEAVTIADEFGTDNSSSFVNGVLAKLAK